MQQAIFKLADITDANALREMVSAEYNKLRAEEEILELEMKNLGRDNFFKKVHTAKEKGQESNTSYGQYLMQRCINPAAQVLEELINEALGGQAGRRSRAALRLQPLNPKTIIFIALKNILENITLGSSKAKVAEKIGHSIEDEARFQFFYHRMPQYFNRLIKNIGTSPSQGKYRHKRRVLVHRMNAKGIEFKKWEDNEYINVGIYLLEIFRMEIFFKKKNKEAVPLITYDQVRARNKKGYLDIVAATKDTQEKIEKNLISASVATPSLQPMICEPNDWIKFWGGGYVSECIRKLSFILNHSQGYKREMEKRVEEMQGVYDAANTVQKTPWRVNNKIFQVVENVWKLNHAIGDLPYQHALEVPPYPIHIEWKDKEQKRMAKESRPKYLQWKKENPELAREVNIKRAKIRRINSKLSSKRIQVIEILNIARKYKDRDKIWFVIQCDFRGRFYCASPFLNFQSADYARCMLEFADGKAIDNETAACWFLINGANLFGYDKVSLQDRVTWAEENKEAVIACAEDPFNNRWWHEADKPFQFLAWCFEVKGFWEQGLGFISHLPVHLDGSCNAYQHMCALMKDEVGGKAVNLIPSEVPEDIYQIIASNVVKQIKDNPSRVGQEWLNFGIDRKATKKVTMTYNYGLTPFSARKYVEEHIEDLQEKGKQTVWGDDLFEASRFLSNRLWQSIADNIEAAPKLMNWLQAVARLAARNNRPMVWTTPSGFYVRQDYPSMDAKRVKTKIGDSTVVVTKRVKSERRVNRRKSANGIVANYIHSMDAAALHISVNTAQAYGIKDFALIHDSYGVHAADVELMSEIIRKVFVEMYKKEDLLEKFKNDLIKYFCIPRSKVDQIPALPEYGNLDLDQVLESEYFFA